jgi:hypothetical protein
MVVQDQTDVRCVLSFISRRIKDSSLLRYADSSLREVRSCEKRTLSVHIAYALLYLPKSHHDACCHASR